MATTKHHIQLIGAPVQEGAGRPGCIMGPDAWRSAGLAGALEALGHRVEDIGNVQPQQKPTPVTSEHTHLSQPSEVAGWAQILQKAAYTAASSCDMPIFLGGDHSIALGTVPGVARYWAEQNRPLFVLWLDAHPDLHTPQTTPSGNLHGVPVAYFAGMSGFDGVFPTPPATVDPKRICMMGIRSVDDGEKRALANLPITVCDMRLIDEKGVAAPLAGFLDRVAAENGVLHVSLDVDFLDPTIAPAVGTTVPGGATFRESHLIMEMLHDSGHVRSLDMAELNPFLDVRARTATLMTDLCASLMGRRLLSRPTRIDSH